MVVLGDEGAVGKIVQRLGERCQWPRRGGGTGKSVQIPDHLDWLVWRLVLARIATLEEIETYYDLLELLDAHEALDLQEEADAIANEVPHGS